jgi:thymidylate synthase
LKRKPKAFPKVTIDKSVKSLATFSPEHVVLEGYDPYPMLKAELTVAGGLYDPKTGKMAA